MEVLMLHVDEVVDLEVEVVVLVEGMGEVEGVVAMRGVKVGMIMVIMITMGVGLEEIMEDMEMVEEGEITMTIIMVVVGMIATMVVVEEAAAAAAEEEEEDIVEAHEVVVGVVPEVVVKEVVPVVDMVEGVAAHVGVEVEIWEVKEDVGVLPQQRENMVLTTHKVWLVTQNPRKGTCRKAKNRGTNSGVPNQYPKHLSTVQDMVTNLVKSGTKTAMASNGSDHHKHNWLRFVVILAANFLIDFIIKFKTHDWH
jgi:hypothetical protein